MVFQKNIKKITCFHSQTLELKVIAIRKHVTVTDILTDLIQEFVNENK